MLNEIAALKVERNRYWQALQDLRDMTDRPWEEVDPDEHIAVIDAALYRDPN